MNKQLSAPVSGKDVVAKTIRSFSAFRADIERTFDDTGNNLGRAVDDLNHLGTQFAALEEALGPSTEAELSGLITAMRDHLGDLNSNCDGFNGVLAKLRRSILSITSEVHELDRVVRTIANISINARIQGNSLVPARPQVTAFIDRLAAMSEESEKILGEINDAMASAGFDIGTMEYEQQEMLRELRQNVIPAIVGFSTMSSRMRDSQTALVAASLDLNDQTQRIFREVSGLIVSLQIGDSTRQRIERIEETLSYAEGMNGREKALLIDLADALAQGTFKTTNKEIQQAVAALEAVQNSSDQAIRSSAGSAFGGNAFRKSGNGKTERERLDKSLAGNRDHFAVLKQQATTVQGRLTVILTHEATLRRIAHEIRLAGINAVIICAKLGRDGRALRELAHWLRDLTDESDTIIQRLQGILAKSREIIRELTETAIDTMESGLESFSQDAENLSDLIANCGSIVDQTGDGVTRIGRTLPDQLSKAMALLSDFSARNRSLDADLEPLRVQRMVLPAPEDLKSDDYLSSVLKGLRAKYTMESERRIHDDVLGSVPGAPARVAEPEPEPAPAGGGDDLDDILF